MLLDTLRARAHPKPQVRHGLSILPQLWLSAAVRAYSLDRAVAARLRSGSLTVRRAFEAKLPPKERITLGFKSLQSPPAIELSSWGVDSSPILNVSGLTKAFPSDYGLGAWLRAGGKRPLSPVLRGIDLVVRRGELFGLLGANGAGKTTLLKMLATLMLPDSGSIELDGIDVVTQPMLAKRRIGLCTSEERSFYYRLSGRANLQFFAALAGLDPNTAERRISEVADLVDLRKSLGLPFSRFSTGMKQRLNLARALLADPPLLFLDEPTRAVDPVHAEEMRVLIREELVRKAGKTVVLATNLLDEAWQICDRIAILRAGRIAAVGTPRELHALSGESRIYSVRVDRVNDFLLDAVRRVAAARPELTAYENGVELLVEIIPTDAALTSLIKALGTANVVLHSFREIPREPMETFKTLSGARDGR